MQGNKTDAERLTRYTPVLPGKTRAINQSGLQLQVFLQYGFQKIYGHHTYGIPPRQFAGCALNRCFSVCLGNFCRRQKEVLFAGFAFLRTRSGAIFVHPFCSSLNTRNQAYIQQLKTHNRITNNTDWF